MKGTRRSTPWSSSISETGGPLRWRCQARRRAAPLSPFAYSPVAAVPTQGTIAPRNRLADVVEHEVMFVRFCQRRAFIAEVAGVFDDFFD